MKMSKTTAQRATRYSQQGLDKPYFTRRQLLGCGFGFVLGGVMLTANLDTQAAGKSSAITIFEQFLKNVQSLRANFKQVVVSPQKDHTQKSSGTFVLARPNQFRFDYTEPYEQQIISDGKTLWLYDVDLEQVTQQDYSQAVGSTPAALLAGGAQAAMAQENFMLSAEPGDKGIQWVKATPRQEDGQIRYAKIGFRNDMLAVLVIMDNFGQESTLTFSDIEIDPSIPAKTFAFEVPKGVDIISQ